MNSTKVIDLTENDVVLAKTLIENCHTEHIGYNGYIEELDQAIKDEDVDQIKAVLSQMRYEYKYTKMFLDLLFSGENGENVKTIDAATNKKRKVENIDK